MTIIEDIEKIKSVYKAKADLAESINHDRACKSYRDIILGIDLALNVVKMQSNTQMQTDGLIAHCKRCKEKVKDWPKFKRDCMRPIGHR